MTSSPFTLTIGWIGRHTPPGAGVDGRDAAVIDIAQDLLLRELHRRGVLDVLLSLIGEIDGLTVGPFAYGVTERRGKWWLTIRSEFVTADST
jgi:hypothetical protein